MDTNRAQFVPGMIPSENHKSPSIYLIPGNRESQLSCNRYPVLNFQDCFAFSVQPFWRRLHMRRKQKRRKIRRPKTRLGLPDLDQSKASVIGSCAHQNRNVVTGMPLTNSSIGIVQNRDCRSIARSCCATDFTWNPGTWLRVRSM